MKHDDPVVERVRKTRHEIVERCGEDNHRLYEWAKQVEAKHSGRIVTYERPGKSTPATE